MKKRSEIVFNDDGSVYHLKLKSKDIADTVILVGDPGRSAMVSSLFDKILFTTSNREFVTYTGVVSNKKITVLSTGIGTDNIDIVVNELDIAVNYDQQSGRFENRRNLNLIRLGTSGAIQQNTHPGTIVLSEYALGIDGLFSFYADDKRVVDSDMKTSFLRECNWPQDLPDPYFVKCSFQLANKVSFDVQRGITVTAPGFYGPQGRTARLNPAYPNLIEKFRNFEYGSLKMLNYEMETSALYALGQSIGFKTLTLCLVIANRYTGDFLSDYKDKMRELISDYVTAE